MGKKEARRKYLRVGGNSQALQSAGGTDLTKCY
jgi:hypothetical protein